MDSVQHNIHTINENQGFQTIVKWSNSFVLSRPPPPPAHSSSAFPFSTFKASSVSRERVKKYSGKYCFLRGDAACHLLYVFCWSSLTSVNNYQTAQRHIPEGLHSHSRENLVSHNKCCVRAWSSDRADKENGRWCPRCGDCWSISRYWWCGLGLRLESETKWIQYTQNCSSETSWKVYTCKTKKGMET
jgi:hypothetical protein